MPNNDQTVIAQVEAQGRSIGELFLIRGRVYWSADAGDFQASSTYLPYEPKRDESLPALVSLLYRLCAPNYDSPDELDDEINLFREWGSLYEELIVLLERHGKLDPFGDGDYYLVEDCYATPQHKVECVTDEAFTPSLVSDVQLLLKKYTRKWEVIFALNAVDGKDHAFSVYSDDCVEHFG